MRLKVRIRQTSACAACSAKAHCNASETKEKLIDVRNERGIPCRAGQEVVICGAASMGMKAVGWAFALPFAVVVASLFLLPRPAPLPEVAGTQLCVYLRICQLTIQQTNFIIL